MEGFPDQYLEARVVGEPKTTAKTDSEATLVVNVEFAPSSVAYKTFASKLCRSLDGICKTKGEFSSVAPKEPRHRNLVENFVIRSDCFAATAGEWMPELWKTDGLGRLNWQSKGFAFAVATFVSTDSSRVNWNYYVLDEAVADAVLRRCVASSHVQAVVCQRRRPACLC